MNFDAIPLQPKIIQTHEQNEPTKNLYAGNLREMLHEDGDRLEELKTTLRSLSNGASVIEHFVLR